MYRNLLEVLEKMAHQHPDRKAFVYLKDGEVESDSCTYRELCRQSQKLAAYFQLLNLEGERIMILLPSGIDYIIAFFGCMYAKSLPVPVYPPSKSRNAERIASIYNDAKPALVIVQSLQDSEKLPEMMRNVHSIKLEEILQSDYEYMPQVDTILSDQIAFLQYTSGSTSAPKGVMVSHLNLLHNFEMMKQRFQHSDHTVMATWLPIYHDMGLIGVVLQNIYNGGCCYIMSPLDFVQKPIRWLRTISKYGVTFSGGPDFAYRLCVQKISDEDKSDLNLSHWVNAFNGAEPVRADTIREFCNAFRECGFREEAMLPSYGLAEGTLCVTVGGREAAPKFLHIDEKGLQSNDIVIEDCSPNTSRAQVGCGQILSYQQIIIVDPLTMIECAAGKAGEIWIKGDSVAKGYWGAPEGSKETFAACLSDTGEGPFLRTGDLGFICDGELYITGRLKDLIIIRGQNYYPHDIEEIAASCHSEINVASTAAFSIDVQGNEELVVLCEMNREFKQIVQRQQLDMEMCLKEITRHIKAEIIEKFQLHTYDIKIVKPLNIPKTSSNKIQRRKCKDMYLNGSLIVWGD